MDANNLSYAEYLAIEQSTNTKYEYHDGTIFAMAGGTVEHGFISGNIYGEIKFGLRNANRDCTVINSEVKLQIEHSNKFLYPDGMVVCGEVKRAKDKKHAISNPAVIIEVLSKSTESYDRGDKFFIYRQIDSVMEYILINQYKAQVEIFKRESDLWKITRIEGLDQRLEISTLGISIELKNIYENVVFSNP